MKIGQALSRLERVRDRQRTFAFIYVRGEQVDINILCSIRKLGNEKRPDIALTGRDDTRQFHGI